MRPVVLVLATVLLAGCSRTSPSLAPPPSSSTTAVALAVVPPVPALVVGMEDHLSLLGWSADSKSIGGCTRLPDGTHCEMRSSTKLEAFTDADDSAPEPTAASTAALKTKVDALNLTSKSGEWPHSDLEITWKVTPGDQDDKRAGVLEVGVRVAGEPIVWVAKLAETKTPYYDRIHPEFIALSPDGKSLGIIAHAFAAEWANAYPSVILSTQDLAKKAYEQAAKNQKDPAKASVFNAKAQTTN